MAFSATARIPCRPLSYDKKDIAEPKEFIIDYEKHTIHLCDINGNIVDISLSVDDILDQIMERLDQKFSDLLKEIEITLPDNSTVIAESAIIEALTKIRDLEITIKDGTAIDSIPAEKVIESTERQFVTEEERNKLKNIGSQNDDVVRKSGDTMEGELIAQNNTNYTTKQVRNIFLIEDGAEIPIGDNGDIVLTYIP